MKESALSEPLVDTVEMKAMVSDPCPVFTIDLNTVTPQELAFSAPFTLRCQRNDFIHALIAWFDIDFTACHKPIRFSTGPHTKYTHWKQTVFYLREVLTVEEGESVEGTLTNKPNATHKRDLDIKIDYQLDTSDQTRFAQGSCDYRMYVLSLNPPSFTTTHTDHEQVLALADANRLGMNRRRLAHNTGKNRS